MYLRMIRTVLAIVLASSLVLGMAQTLTIANKSP